VTGSTADVWVEDYGGVSTRTTHVTAIDLTGDDGQGQGQSTDDYNDDDHQRLGVYRTSGGEIDTTFENLTVKSLGQFLTSPDMTSVKTFEFRVSVPNGKTYTLDMIPYAGVNATGLQGRTVRRLLAVAPRTNVSFEDRDLQGRVSRTKSLARFSVNPTIPTTNVVGPAGTLSSTVSTLTDSGKTWVVDQYESNPTDNPLQVYYVKITTVGTVASGQVRKIVSNTATELTVTPNWANTPTSSDTYEIVRGASLHRIGTAGVFKGDTTPVEVDKLTGVPLEQRTVQFYSEIAGLPVEEVQTVVVDEDNDASLLSFAADEIVGGEINCTITGGDDDAKWWHVYAKKASGSPFWPTISGNQPSTTQAATGGDLPDLDYLRFQDTITNQSFDFAAGNGDWYIIAYPLDAFNNYGIPSIVSALTVTGTGSAEGSLSALNVVANDNTIPDPDDYYNEIQWNHNTNVDTTSENGTATTVTTTVLTDTGASFDTAGNGLTNQFLRLVSGAGGATGEVRPITSNTATTITVSPAFSVDPTDTATYEVTKFEVKIFAYRTDRGSQTEVEITTAAREARLDVGSDYDNSADENDTSGEGSFLHAITDGWTRDASGAFKTWNYRVELYDNDPTTPTLVSSYTTSHMDKWLAPVPSFATGPTVAQVKAGTCPPYNGNDYTNSVTYTCSDPDDSNYYVRVEVSRQSSPSTYSTVATDLTTVGDTVNNIYPTLARTGSNTEYFTYRMKIIKKSDQSVIETSGTATAPGHGASDFENCEQF